MSKNDKSLKKLNAQIAKLSKEKEKNEKTPVVKKKELVRKVKAKEVDEEIEKNKKNPAPKKRKIPENVEIKDLGNIKVKKNKKKKIGNNSKTKKEVKKINDNNILVDEEITTFSNKISSQDIKELENSLREIYDKEIITKKHPNKDFFINDFLSNVNDRINRLSGKAKDISKDLVDKAVELSETPVKGGRFRNIDILSIITIFLGIVFVICAISFVGFIIWICYY